MFNPNPLRARRKLLAVCIFVAMLATLSYLNYASVGGQSADIPAVVAISQTPTVTPTDAEIDAAVRQAVGLAGGLPETVAPGKKIVIQPNLVQAGHPAGNGVCTNAQVVRTIIAMCLEKGASVSDIKICEGSASFYIDQGSFSSREMTKQAYRNCGLDAVAPYMVEDMYGVELIDANDCGTGERYDDYPDYSGPYNEDKVTEVIRPGRLIDRVYMLPNPVVVCDVLIRVPTLKNHNMAGVTGALKLGFGLAPSDIYHYPGEDRYKWSLLHQEVWGYGELETNARGMVDMNLCRPPDFVVIDGLVGVQNGPCGNSDGGGGYIQPPPNGNMRCILASADPVATDTIQTLLFGYKVSSIPSLKLARDAGLGTNDLCMIEVRGVPVAQIRQTFRTWGCAVKDPDRTGPTLADINVPNGTHVCGAVLVRPTVTPLDTGSGLCKAELRVDGVLVSSNCIDYSTKWFPTNQPDGEHVIRYTIYDQMLNETSITRTVYLHKGDPIKMAFGLEDGVNIWLGPVEYTGAGVALGSNTFFVCSGRGIPAIRVLYSSAPPSMSPGQRVFLYGSLSMGGGSRYLNCTSSGLYDSVTPVRPMSMNNRTLGGGDLNPVTPGVYMGRGAYNIGCLVTVTGRVSVGGSDYFYIDDGSLVGDPGGVAKLKIKCGSFGQPQADRYVQITGWSCTESDGKSRRLLVVRSAADIRELQ